MGKTRSEGELVSLSCLAGTQFKGMLHIIPLGLQLVSLGTDLSKPANHPAILLADTRN
jgi:hypothetical protein